MSEDDKEFQFIRVSKKLREENVRLKHYIKENFDINTILYSKEMIRQYEEDLKWLAKDNPEWLL